MRLSFGIVAVAAVAVCFGVASADAVTSKKLVAVQVDEYSVFPAAQGSPVGKVRFVVTNVGTIEHEFVVIKTVKPAGNLLKGNEANETGAVGELDGVKPGNARVLVLNLKRGHYALLCNLPATTRRGSSPTSTCAREITEADRASPAHSVVP